MLKRLRRYVFGSGGMDQLSDTTGLESAYDAGKQAGRSGICGPDDCPFSRDALQLRIAWLDGLADGQREAPRHRLDPLLRNDVFGSGITALSRPQRS